MSILPIISNIDDLAQAIDDPPPNRPIERRIGEQGRKICDAFSNVPDWAKNLGNPAIPLLGLVCEPYFANNGISPPEYVPPFTGGQCQVNYTVTIQSEVFPFSDCSTFGPSISANGFSGPILGLVTRTENPSGDLCTPAGNAIYLRHGNPVVESLVAGAGYGATASILSVVREDGLPDNCGDPPPEVQPGPNPSPTNPTIPPDEQPYDDPIYGPTLPLPPIIIAPELPDFEISIDPFGNGGGTPNLDPGEPGEPVETGLPGGGGGGGGGGDGVAEGEAPPGQELVGVRLDLVEALPLSAQYGDGIYRGGAYIYMGGPNGLDQDFGGSQVKDGQFFYAEREGLTKWRVASNVGLNWSVVPFYREVV